jgi:hypothetical protein
MRKIRDGKANFQTLKEPDCIYKNTLCEAELCFAVCNEKTTQASLKYFSLQTAKPETKLVSGFCNS